MIYHLWSGCIEPIDMLLYTRQDDVMASTPKYRKIYQDLLHQIHDHHLQHGERLPSELELARTYHVSRPTVTRALNDLRREGLLVRRSGAGSFVQLSGEPLSPKSGTDTHRRFGLLVPRLGEIFEPIANRIAELAHDLDFSLLWVGTTNEDSASPEMYEQTCRRYIEHQVDGIFLVTMELTPEADRVNRRVMELLLQADIAVILIDSDFEVFPRRSRFDLVGIDNLRSGYLAASHLLERGAGRIDFFQQPYAAPTVGARIRGYEEALKDAGISPAREWVHNGDPADSAYVRDCLEQGAENIICGNDATAAELMHTITELGYSIPGDVRIVGFDDMKYARLARVPLTTFRQPCRQLGEIAVEAMFSRLSKPGRNPVTVYAEPELITRESSHIPHATQQRSEPATQAPGL